MVKSKKGWVAVIEVCLAIVILFTFLMLTFTKETEPQSSVYTEIGKAILWQVEHNESFRNMVLANKTLDASNSVNFIVNSSSRLMGEACISLISGSCSVVVPEKKEIVSYDFFVIANETMNSGNKLKVFVWDK